MLLEKLINTFKLKSALIKSILLFLALIASISIIFFVKPATVAGYTVPIGEFTYTDSISLVINNSSEYSWNLENKGLLKSVKLNGEVKDSGTVKIYLEYENETYLIFDNKKLEEVEEIEIPEEISDNISNQTKINETFGNGTFPNGLETNASKTIDTVPINLTNATIIDNTINEINQNNTINNENIINKTNQSQAIENQTIETNEIGTINDQNNNTINSKTLNKNPNDNNNINNNSNLINETDNNINENINNETTNLTPITNETLPLNQTINITEPINYTNSSVPLNDSINITPIANETVENISVSKIDINLEYKANSIYDGNDDGIERIDSVIDITVENSNFNWNVNEENLCTRWETYSIENEESTTVCYGSSNCCNFIDLVPKKDDWNEIFYATYGQYGAALNNIISAQVLYVDYNLSLENPYSEIYYSDWKNLSAEFYQGFVSFENICAETCILPDLNATSYKLIFEIFNSSIILDSISYEIYGKINSIPILSNNFSNITFFENEVYTINLCKYFYDHDSDTLTFDYYNNSKLDVEIINETAILKPGNFTGTTYMFFTANDSVDITISNVFEIEVKEKFNIFDLPGLKSLRKLAQLV